jgi:hypothetical protein
MIPEERTSIMGIAINPGWTVAQITTLGTIATLGTITTLGTMVPSYGIASDTLQILDSKKFRKR